MKFHKATIVASAFIAPLFFSGAVQAQSVIGTISAELVLTKACTVNGSSASTEVDFGALNFDTKTTLFTTSDATLASSIEFQCSNGSTAVFTFGNGANHDGSLRNLKRGATTDVVPYRLYSDSGFSTEVTALGISVPANGTVQTLDLFARATNSSTTLAAGTYTDSIAVTLSF